MKPLVDATILTERYLACPDKTPATALTAREHDRTAGGSMFADSTDLDAEFLAEVPLGASNPYRYSPFTGALPTRQEALSLLGSALYAVRMPDGLIKIGWSDHLDTRLAHLPKATILAVKAGTRADETALHHSLAAHVHHGKEWYFPTPEVMAVVNDWRVTLGLKSVA